MKQRAHAELIKLWADGAEVEAKQCDGRWIMCHAPMWGKESEYRVKALPTPDRVHKVRMWIENIPNGTFGGVGTKVGLRYSSLAYYVDDANLKLTFDGETGKLKSAEVIA